MRKISYLLLITCIFTQKIIAQNTEFSLNPTNFKEGEIVQSLYDFNDHKFWAMLGIRTTVDGKNTYDYALTQFNNEFEQIKRLKLPNNLPKYCYPFVFGNYIAFNGYNESNSWNGTRKENIIVFTDREFNSVKEISFKVQKENFCYSDNISLTLSEDSTKLICFALVNETAGKPGGPKYRAFIEVYDSKLEVVWQKSFYISKYMGDDPQPINCMMLNDSRIVLISADKDGSSTKLRLCIFGDQETEPEIRSRTFKYPKMSFKSYFREPGTIVIGGMLSNADAAKEMFFLSYDVIKNDFVFENTFQLNKKFTSAYPEISKQLNKGFPITSYYSTDHFLPWGDGSLMVYDGSFMSDNVYLAWPITFISFNSEGQVNWVKLIPRFLRTYYDDYATYKVFKQGEKLQIFYGDDPESNGSMKIPANGRFTLGNLGLFYNELDISGNLTPGTMLSKTSSEEFRVRVAGLFRIDKNVFVAGLSRHIDKKKIFVGNDIGIIKIIEK